MRTKKPAKKQGAPSAEVVAEYVCSSMDYQIGRPQ